MADHRAKLSFAVAEGVAWLVKTSSFPTFDTFTFADNVQDKAEAARRWRCLKARLQRHYPGLRGVGVWQRQRRGAWHLHYVFDRLLDVKLVRPWAVECGFGSQLNMRAVGSLPGMRQGMTPGRVARYLTRYITRDVDVDDDDKGVRVADYCGDARVASTAFRWVGGIAFLWRQGRQAWSDMFGMPAKFKDTWFLVRLGWEVITDSRRACLEEDSGAVCRWAYPEKYPF